MVLAGHVDEISRSRVQGWAVARDLPGKYVSVSIFVNGQHRATCEANRFRPGVILPCGEPAPDHCAFMHEFDPPLSPFSEHHIKVQESSAGRMLPNGEHRLTRPIGIETGDQLSPILVTSVGRSGSTLLMDQLIRSAGIVGGDHYPYEIKQIAYHAAAFRALVAPGDRRRSTDPDTMLGAGHHHWIGGNPYYDAGFFHLADPGTRLRDFYERAVPANYTKLFKALIDGFYSILAESQGKRNARFFCEKGMLDETVREGARLFFHQVREVILVRDPRDLLCSMTAFWKQSSDDAMALLRSVIPQLRQVAGEARPDVLVIRYEDLIRAPLRVRANLSIFLSLDLRNPPTGRNDAIPASHRTSISPEASIGRWRWELTPEQIEVCNVEFSDFLREFDYP
jgi:hypothetical protein